jgi:hypothetical protein
MLFTARSLTTMLHGLVLGGGALLVLAISLFTLWLLTTGDGTRPSDRQLKSLSRLLVAAAVLLWLGVLGGTYLVFPPYRATPPEGLADLSAYPRSLLLASPETAWLHGFAMETKEHVPWIATMFATAAAFVSVRYRGQMVADPRIRRLLGALASICLLLVGYVALLGVFVNKVAPLD